MTLNILRIDFREADAETAFFALREKLSPEGNVVSEAGRQKTLEVFGEPLSPTQVVEHICSKVKREGVAAVLEYNSKLDQCDLTAETLRVPAAELAKAHAEIEVEYLESVRRIRQRIVKFQTAILHADVEVQAPAGGKLCQRYLPLQRVGICVPGGAAAYPSTVLMTALPAQVAGVQELVVVAPPTPFGSYNQHLLATCHELGITEVYRMGGAQAVAAMAYGLNGLPTSFKPVDKIVGPGNLFVALAKRHVYGTVDIDSIAGPSEVVVLADETTSAEYAAADMIAQAEHSPGSSIIISWYAPLLDQLQTALETQLKNLARGALATTALETFGAMILVKDREAAAKLADLLATEHLHIECRDPEEMLSKIRCAGAVFMGPYSPVAVGDYTAGPSHVLPTGATARFASGLSANDFLRSNSVISYTEAGLREVAEDAICVANIEGLTGHAASIKIRCKD